MTAGVAHAFGRAAATYDTAAVVQRRAATVLAARIAALDLPPAPRVLELGCGTGLLTGALGAMLSPGWYLATDLAAPMVQACRARHPAPARCHAVMDGEAPCVGAARFDLICASLAVQWFADPPGALARLHPLLRPGGVLAIASLGPGSLAEWRAAHVAEGCPPPTPPFDAPSRLVAAWPGAAELTTETILIRHDSGLGFLRGLRAIGADMPRHGHTPLPPGTLRRVLARFEREGAVARYDLVFATCRS